jgi:hypothetical protein
MKAKTILGYGIAFNAGNNLIKLQTMSIVLTAITHAAAIAHSMGSKPR